MAIRVNPKLINELQAYGAEDVSKCYHCGNCTATCPFAKEPYMIPRASTRSLQMGLEKKLESELHPWLCYYCGECSKECPRGAEPGETMMSLRRWLTARYDFTGIARLFYRNWKIELFAILAVAVLAGLGFLLFGLSQGDINSYNGPNAFLPAEAVHRFDLAVFLFAITIVGINVIRMWWFTIGRDTSRHVPFGAYLRQIYLPPLHFFTQKRYAQCEHTRRWWFHMLIVYSYITMDVLIIVFLARMWSGPEIDWRVHVFGLLAGVGLLITTSVALRNRIKKTEPVYKHSHPSDWFFLLLIMIIAATGMLQFFLHRVVGADAAANVAYLVHMMAVMPFLLLVVPFSKWTHIVYRPLAMYFSKVRLLGEPVVEKPVRPAEPAAALGTMTSAVATGDRPA